MSTYLAAITPDIAIVMFIIFLTMVLFIIEIVRMDVVACLVLVLLGLTNVIPTDTLFSGFSSEAVITLIAIMILGEGLEKSGVVQKLTSFILNIGKYQETRVRLSLMLFSGVLSGFLRSVGALTLLIPVVTRLRRLPGFSRYRLLLPLGFCAILGSTLTLVGSGPLILLNHLIENIGTHSNLLAENTMPIGFFEIFPIGITLLCIGIGYFHFFSKWLLPKSINTEKLESNMNYFMRTYKIGGEFIEVKVPSESPLNQLALRQWEELLPEGVEIVGIRTHDTVYTPPLRKMEIKSGATIVMLGSKDLVEKFTNKYNLKMHKRLTRFADKVNPMVAGLCEIVTPPSSNLIGKNYRDLHMRRHFGIQVLALLRGNEILRGNDLSNVVIRSGDTMCLFCDWRALSMLEHNPDFIVVTTDYPKETIAPKNMGWAIFFFALAMFFVLFTNVSISTSLLLGATGMVFSRVLSIDDAYDAISWRTVFLLAGLIPLGIAVQTSGLSAWISGIIADVFPNMHSAYMMLILGIMSMAFSLVLTNVGATVILVPLAIEIAARTGDDPRAFALMVAILSSNVFILPTHQANALITGPGRYQVSDFVRSGMALSMIYLLVVWGMLLWIY